MQNHIQIILILIQIVKKLEKYSPQTYKQGLFTLSDIQNIREILASSINRIEKLKIIKPTYLTSHKLITAFGEFFTLALDVEDRVCFLGELRQQIETCLHDTQQNEFFTVILKEIWHSIYECQKYFAESFMYLTHSPLSNPHSPYA
jgi:hypothetical protein